MNCCTNIYDLGCFDSCDTITLNEATVGVDMEYSQNGTYRFQFETQFRFKFNQTGTAGELITLDLSLFPENKFLELKIFNPDGTRYTVMVSSSEQDCFSLRADHYVNSIYTPVVNVTANTCCNPKIIRLSGVETYTLVPADWAQFGTTAPTIEVYYKDGLTYIPIPVQPIINGMPTPTSIIVTIPGIPADDWFIKLS